MVLPIGLAMVCPCMSQLKLHSNRIKDTISAL